MKNNLLQIGAYKFCIPCFKSTRCVRAMDYGHLVIYRVRKLKIDQFNAKTN